jgi:hypothetical protein
VPFAGPKIARTLKFPGIGAYLLRSCSLIYRALEVAFEWSVVDWEVCRRVRQCKDRNSVPSTSGMDEWGRRSVLLSAGGEKVGI